MAIAVVGLGITQITAWGTSYYCLGVLAGPISRGFLGPLALGATLDLLGGASVIGWGVAFGHVTVALLLRALTFAWLRPADLAGDRSVTAATAGAPLRRT
jgi:hypothetical protein